MRKTQTKEEALSLMEERRSAFLAKCRMEAFRIFNNKGQVTIDDVRDVVELPEDIDGRVFGAVFNSKSWERIGYTTTKRKSSHRRPIAIFKYK